MTSSPDFVVENHGSILLLYPRTDAASAWATDYLWASPDGVMTFGPGIVVEPRYMDDIIMGIESSGLTVVPA